MIKIYTNLSGKQENNEKLKNFTILKQQTKLMVLTENPCHLPLDGAV